MFIYLKKWIENDQVSIGIVNNKQKQSPVIAINNYYYKQ